MLSKLYYLAALLPLINALTIDTPTNWTSSDPAILSWTSTAGDPSTWSFELVNVDNFHNSFAISNNVNPSLGSLSLTLPTVPVGSGYTVQAVNISNIGQVFAESGSFSIGAAISSTSSSASSTSSAASTSASGSASLTASGASGSSTSTTPFGTTVSGSSTASNSGSATGSGTASGTSSSGSATPTNFGNGNSGAASLGISSWMALVAAAAAGVAVVA